MFLLAVLALMATGAVQAQGHGRAGNAPPANAAVVTTDPKRNSNLPESVRRVERQTGGEVLRAEPMQQDGHEVYRMKVLTRDGRVRVVQDDPAQPANTRNARKPEPIAPTPIPKADKDGG
jgi:hypothetical protein